MTADPHSLASPAPDSPQGAIIRRRALYETAIAGALGTYADPRALVEGELLELMQDCGIPPTCLAPPALGIAQRDNGDAWVKPVGRLRDWVEGRV